MGLEKTSQLDRMIARLTTQRDHLEAAAIAIRDVPGLLLEIGLGNGWSYDHLSLLFPDREIYTFVDGAQAPPSRAPDADHLFAGDYRETLAAATDRLPGQAALAHIDFGGEGRERDAAQPEWLAPLIGGLMAPAGVVISDRSLAVTDWTTIEGPQGACPYFMWRLGQ